MTQLRSDARRRPGTQGKPRALIFDALNGVVWHNDTQVVDMVIRKRHAAVPGVAMEILRVSQVDEQKPLALEPQS